MTDKRPTVDLVPLADRVRYMRLFRFAAVVLVAALALIDADSRTITVGALLMGTAGYLGASLAAEGLWRLSRTRGLLLFGIMLMFDGVFLTGLTVPPVA